MGGVVGGNFCFRKFGTQKWEVLIAGAHWQSEPMAAEKSDYQRRTRGPGRIRDRPEDSQMTRFQFKSWGFVKSEYCDSAEALADDALATY